jgi:hypothetical protein
MANEVAATEARTIIIVQRYRWPNELWLAGWSRARPHLIVPGPARHERRVMLGTQPQPVVLTRLGFTQCLPPFFHQVLGSIFFYFTKKRIYICTIYIQY